MEKAMVLSADKWDMKDENTGEQRTGWSLWYVSNYRESSINAIGLRPSRISVTDEVVNEVRKMNLPLMAELDFTSRPGAAGRATIVINALKPISQLPDFFKSKQQQPAT